MKTGAGIAIGLSVALAAGGGYWLGQRPVANHSEPSVAAVTAPVEGMKKERKLLYYRNPMGLPDTSPTPKKDPMGMDYVPVYQGEADDEPAAARWIKISTEKVQKLGVRTEAAQLRALDKVVRASGRIEPDERRMYAISPKFEGYVERLHVNVTGQPVGKGQPLFEVYSPELVSAQREYAIAAQGVGRGVVGFPLGGDLGLHPRLKQAVRRDGRTVGHLHIGEEHTGIGLIDAELVLHRR